MPVVWMKQCGKIVALPNRVSRVPSLMDVLGAIHVTQIRRVLECAELPPNAGNSH